MKTGEKINTGEASVTGKLTTTLADIRAGTVTELPEWFAKRIFALKPQNPLAQ